MGHKVNPNGFRLGYIKNHKAIWYSDKKNFSIRLKQDFLIRNYILKNYEKAFISDVILERKGERVLIIIKAARPGILIGKKGESIEKVKTFVNKITNSVPKVIVKEVKKIDLDAKLVAMGVAKQLEKRVVFRRAMKKAMQSVLQAGAKGVKIMVSGRLGGVDIARSEVQKNGKIPLHTMRADIDYSVAEALTTYGIIGVKVWIYKGNIYKNNELNKLSLSN